MWSPFAVVNKNKIDMATEVATEKKQIDWQILNDNQEVTIADFRTMVENSEKAPHISIDEFVQIIEALLQN
jgi:hypothetical protein